MSDVLSNMDMFDLENNLPDELMSSSSWGITDNMGTSKPPAQGPGPGGMQNGMDSNDNSGNSNLRQMQLNHILQQVCINLSIKLPKIEISFHFNLFLQ